jgi:hypothetical protein
MSDLCSGQGQTADSKRQMKQTQNQPNTYALGENKNRTQINKYVFILMPLSLNATTLAQSRT